MHLLSFQPNFALPHLLPRHPRSRHPICHRLLHLHPHPHFLLLPETLPLPKPCPKNCLYQCVSCDSSEISTPSTPSVLQAAAVTPATPFRLLVGRPSESSHPRSRCSSHLQPLPFPLSHHSS